MKHVSDKNAAKEIEVAVAFDLRDNPAARDFVDHLVKTKGVKGSRDFVDAILREIKAEYNEDRSNMMFPWTRAAVRTLIAGGMTYESMENFGLGFLGPLIGGILTAGITAGATVYSSKLSADAQKDIAKIQTSVALEQAKAATAAAEAVKAQSIAAMQGGGAPIGGTATMSAGFMSGGPGIGTIALLGALGLGAYFLLPKLMGK